MKNIVEEAFDAFLQFISSLNVGKKKQQLAEILQTIVSQGPKEEEQLRQSLQALIDSLQVMGAWRKATMSRTTQGQEVKVTKPPACAEVKVPLRDPTQVQIKADKVEIERRIAAFMERKRGEVDDENRREFCNIIQDNSVDSCARTDAVYVPRNEEGKSHVRVSRVVNQHGPQTRCVQSCGSNLPVKQVAHSSESKLKLDGIEERMQNMEAHLHVSEKGSASSPGDVYLRLRALEERILFLESLSPEYFHCMCFTPKRKKAEEVPKPANPSPVDENVSISEIDQRISNLRQSLLSRSNLQHPYAHTHPMQVKTEPDM